MLTIATGLCIAVTAFGQPENDNRREMLEQRRALLVARLAEIESELSGETPAGTVRLFGQDDARSILDHTDPREDRPLRPGRGVMREQGRTFDAETRERLLEELEQNDPELAARIRTAMLARGGAFSPVFGRLGELNRLRQNDPEAFTVRREEMQAGLDVLKLSGQLRDLLATDGDQPQIEKAMERLRAAVTRGFDAKGAVLKNEIERSEQRVSGMTGKLKYAEANRSQIIEQHFDGLVKRIRRAAKQQREAGD